MIEGGRRRDDREWDFWMTSPSQWTWVLVNSGSWWWTGRPGVLQSMGSQRDGHDWETEVYWTAAIQFCLGFFFFNASIFDSLKYYHLSLVQLSSVAQSCPTLRDPMDCSTPGLPVHRQLPEFTKTHVHWVSDTIQPSHPLSSPFPPAFNLSQHQGLFQWVSSSHQVAKVLEFQLQHQSFQWIFRTDFL